MNQAQQILAHLQTGAGITAIEALDRFRCFRLAAQSEAGARKVNV